MVHHKGHEGIHEGHEETGDAFKFASSAATNSIAALPPLI